MLLVVLCHILIYQNEFVVRADMPFDTDDPQNPAGQNQGKNSYSVISEVISQAVNEESGKGVLYSSSSFKTLHQFIFNLLGSTAGSTCNDDLACLAAAADHDKIGLEAIQSLHKQLDDDANGNIDLSESDDVSTCYCGKFFNRDGMLPYPFSIYLLWDIFQNLYQTRIRLLRILFNLNIIIKNIQQFISGISQIQNIC